MQGRACVYNAIDVSFEQGKTRASDVHAHASFVLLYSTCVRGQQAGHACPYGHTVACLYQPLVTIIFPGYFTTLPPPTHKEHTCTHYTHLPHLLSHPCAAILPCTARYNELCNPTIV